MDAYKKEHHIDIADLYERGSICIEDYEASLKRDAALIRSHAGTPKHVSIFGYFYDIDTGVLTEVVKDKAETVLIAVGSHLGGAITNSAHTVVPSTWNKP